MNAAKCNMCGTLNEVDKYDFPTSTKCKSCDHYFDDLNWPSIIEIVDWEKELLTKTENNG